MVGMGVRSVSPTLRSLTRVLRSEWCTLRQRSIGTVWRAVVQQSIGLDRVAAVLPGGSRVSPSNLPFIITLSTTHPVRPPYRLTG